LFPRPFRAGGVKTAGILAADVVIRVDHRAARAMFATRQVKRCTVQAAIDCGMPASRAIEAPKDYRLFPFFPVPPAGAPSGSTGIPKTWEKPDFENPEDQACTPAASFGGAGGVCPEPPNRCRTADAIERGAVRAVMPRNPMYS
jgi:hypothetical protein